MSIRIEWLRARVEPATPDDLDVAAPDGNDRRDYGLAIAGDEVTMVYGSLVELERFAQRVSAGVEAIKAHHAAALRVEERQLEPQPQESGLLGSHGGGAGPGQVP